MIHARNYFINPIILCYLLKLVNYYLVEMFKTLQNVSPTVRRVLPETQVSY